MRRLGSAGIDFSGRVVRQGSHIEVLPYVQVDSTPRGPAGDWEQGGYFQCVVNRKSDIDMAFADPSDFLQVFTGREDLGDRWLLTRHLDAIDEHTLWKRVWPEAWHHARTARPGVTMPGHGRVEDWQLAHWEAGPRTLRIAGYHPGLQDLELTCVLGPGEHVGASEITWVRNVIQWGKLPDPDGRPLKTMRIVFPDRESAVRERRPLLDGGARVQYIDESGAVADVPVE